MGFPQQSNLSIYCRGNLNQSGTFQDFSGNDRHGTLVSAPPQIETPYGSALDFDGGADRVTFGNIGNDIKSVSLVIRIDALTNYLIDFDGTDTIDILTGTLRANSIVNAHLYVNGVIGTAIEIGGFYHIAVTTDTALNASAFVLANIGANFGDGVFSHLAAWSVELDGDEVAEMYRQMNYTQTALR